MRWIEVPELKCGGAPDYRPWVETATIDADRVWRIDTGAAVLTRQDNSAHPWMPDWSAGYPIVPASVLRLDNGEAVAVNWTVEDAKRNLTPVREGREG